MKQVFLFYITVIFLLLGGCSMRTEILIVNLGRLPITVDYIIDTNKEDIFRINEKVFFYQVKPESKKLERENEINNPTFMVDSLSKRISFKLLHNQMASIGNHGGPYNNDPSSPYYVRFNLISIKITTPDSNEIYAEGNNSRYLFGDVKDVGKALIIR